MSNTIIELRHSYVTGNVPSSLANGEIAINTYDGKLFYRGGPSNTVQTIERYSGPAGLDTEIQFNESGVLGSSANLTFNKLTGLFRAGNVTANTVTTRDYIQFGDGTRQYTANAGSGSGSGTTINVYNANTQVFTETANGTGTTFNLGFVPASQNNIIVSSNGVVQYDYTLSSSTLIFNFTPPAGALIRVQTFGTSQANSLNGIFQTGNLIVYDGNTLVSLANTNTAGTYGNSTHVPVITTDAYGRVLSVTNTSISGLGASDQYARDTANAAFGTANSAGSYANAAFIHANSAFNAANNALDTWVRGQANAAFNAANTADAKAVTAGSYANSAFIVANSAAIAANTPSHVANSAAIYANGAFAKANTQDAINLTQNNSITAAFIRANNSLDANNGGTVTGTITATSFITTGSYGNIQGANIIYANTFVANTGFIQFADGSKQYTANAGSDQYAGNTANAAFETANNEAGVNLTQNTTIEASFSHANSAFNTANNEAGVNATQNNTITASLTAANSAGIYANGAFNRANNSLNANTGGTITGDLSITGNLSVLGNTFSVSATTLLANDTILVLGANNYTSDLLDIGFAAHYNDGVNAHVGFIRDSGTKEWQLFEGYVPEIGANNQIDINDPSFKIATLNANLHSTKILVKGIDLLPYVNNAFELANTAAIAANTPSHVANSASIYANGAFTVANNAFTSANGTIAWNTANAAFDAANNALDTWVRGQANAAFNQANAAFTVANAAFTTANGTIAWNTANAAFDTANNEAGVNLSQNTTIQAAFSQANGAFALANNESGVNATQNNSITVSFEAANSAGVYANGAFNRANNSINANTGGSITGDVFISGNLTVTGLTTYTNTATLLVNDNIITVNNGISQSGEPLLNAGLEVNRGAQPNSSILWIETSGKWAANNGNTQYFLGSDAAEAYANAAFLVANTANDKATSAGIYANGAFQAANSAGVYANSAYVHANAGFVIANDAFFFANVGIQNANTAHNKANAAFIAANAAFIAANNQAGVNLTQNTNIQFAWNHANAAFLQANTGGSGVKIDVYNANTNVFTDTANGTGTTFSLGFTPNSANNIIVSANGVVQYDYSLAGSTLILNFTPTIGTLIRVQSFGSSQANSLNGIFQTGNLIVYDGNTLVSLANTNTPGTFGNSTHIPVITTDSYGRITGVVNTTIGISGDDQYARNTANAAFNAANNEAGVNATQNTNITFAANHANAAFDSANTKTYTYVQSVVPATANVAGALWQNTSSGIVYMNFGNTSNPIWAEL